MKVKYKVGKSRKRAAGGFSSMRNVVQQLGIQRKLTVGEEDDEFEREADKNANRVMRMPEHGFIQRKCQECEKEEKLRRLPTSGSPDTFAQSHASGPSAAGERLSKAIQSTCGRGQSLDRSTQSFMNSRMGAEFSGVNVHTDTEAAQLNSQLHSRAFTIGSDIYFNEGQYKPESASGKHLLAHELTHVMQQTGSIRRAPMPKDAFGRPLGFFPTPEQEAYDRETHEIKEWEKVLVRLKNGELDDRDLANWRLVNRINGLLTADVNTLITNIQAHQKKNTALTTTKILEYLEVRKQISTPMPDGASVSRDPITQTIDSYSIILNNIRITVLSDTFGNAGNETGPTTNFTRSYKWTSNSKGIITSLASTESGSAIAINPTSLEVTIITKYKDSPDNISAYGKGTTEYDKEEKTTTLRTHEGQHGTDYIDYIRKNPLPVDISKGVVGVLTINQFRQIESYIKGITKDSCESTDQSGFSQDEFLKTPAGKSSGITSCRKP
jgi:hypothetical protein